MKTRNEMLRRKWLILLVIVPLGSQASVVDEQLAAYRASGAGPFNAQKGEQLWRQEVMNAKDGRTRSCTTCHGNNLRSTGKHIKTGKVIEPLSPAVNAERLSSAKKIRKWFKRNCKWTWGRECTPQEKGDLLSFMRNQ